MSLNGKAAQGADPQTSERQCNCGLPSPAYGPHDPDCAWWDHFGSCVPEAFDQSDRTHDGWMPRTLQQAAQWLYPVALHYQGQQ